MQATNTMNTAEYKSKKENDMQRAFDNKINFLFRLAASLCFIGHGFHGVYHGGKSGWLPFFEGISAAMGTSFFIDNAWTLMPLVGGIDIALGILILFRVSRAQLGYMFAWGVMTALLRPLAGQGFMGSEVLERFYNFIPALTLLGISLSMNSLGSNLLTGFGLFRSLPVFKIDVPRALNILKVFAVSASVFFAGYAIYCLVDDKGTTIRQLQFLGLGGHLATLGYINVACALAILVGFRSRIVVGACFIVKLGTELMYLTDGFNGHGTHLTAIFEIVERGGAYVMLAIMFILIGYLRKK